MTGGTIECRACGRKVAAQAARCPFCNALNTGGGKPARPAEAAAVPNPEPAKSPPRCPLCQGAPGPGTLTAIVWKADDSFMRVMFSNYRWRGRVHALPAPCSDCQRWLTMRRLVTLPLLLVPAILMFAMLIPEGLRVVGLLMLTAYFTFGVLAWPAYGWADEYLYGTRVKSGYGTALPKVGRVHVPVHLLYGIFRVFFVLFVIAFGALFVVLAADV